MTHKSKRYLKCHRNTLRIADCNEKQKPNVNKIGKNTPDLLKNIRLNGVETAAYIGSGSNYSLIRKSFVESIGECSDCEFVLKCFAGEEYSSTKKIRILLEIDGNMFETEMFLVEDDLLSESLLLGRDIIRREGNAQ